MAEPQLIMAIGRIERALSRIEQAPQPLASSSDNPELLAKHERLKAEAKAVVANLDALISGKAQ